MKIKFKKINLSKIIKIKNINKIIKKFIKNFQKINHNKDYKNIWYLISKNKFAEKNNNNKKDNLCVFGEILKQH